MRRGSLSLPGVPAASTVGWAQAKRGDRGAAPWHGATWPPWPRAHPPGSTQAAGRRRPMPGHPPSGSHVLPGSHEEDGQDVSPVALRDKRGGAALFLGPMAPHFVDWFAAAPSGLSGAVAR